MTHESQTIKVRSLELLRQYQTEPSSHLRNRIVELNIGLVRQEAHYWKHICSESFEDLMQIGSLGLIQAVEKYQPERGVTFGAFSKPYIRGSIQHYLRDRSNTVRIPRRMQELLRRKHQAVEQLRASLQRTPTTPEICQTMGITSGEWQQMELAQRNRSILSLDAPVSKECDLPLGEGIADAHYQHFQLAEEDRMCLIQELGYLERRTRTILECLFLRGLTHHETARQLNTSTGTVYRHMRKGIGQLSRRRAIALAG
ncbi:MAG: sigma-70 family RNA polymerase sigma factor [Cyanobacteria bacterium J06639_1]